MDSIEPQLPVGSSPHPQSESAEVAHNDLDREIVDQGEVIFCQIPRKRFETILQQWAVMTLGAPFKRTSTFTAQRATWVLRKGRWRWVWSLLAAMGFVTALASAYFGANFRREIQFTLIEGETSSDLSKGLGSHVPILEFPIQSEERKARTIGLWAMAQGKAEGTWLKLKDSSLSWGQGWFFSLQNLSPSPLISVDVAVTDKKSGVRRVFRHIAGGHRVDLGEYAFQVAEVGWPQGLAARIQLDTLAASSETEKVREDFWVFKNHKEYDFSHRRKSPLAFEILGAHSRWVAEVRATRDPSFVGLFIGVFLLGAGMLLYWMRPYRKWVVTWTPETATIATFGTWARGTQHQRAQVVLTALVRYLNTQAEKRQREGNA